MSLTNKKRKELDKYLFLNYGLNPESASSKTKLLYSKGEDSVFLENKYIPVITSIGKSKENHYEIFSSSISFVRSSSHLLNIYDQLGLVINLLQDLKLFIASRFKNFTISYESIKTILYNGNVDEINKEFKPFTSFSITILNNGKNTKMIYVTIDNDNIYFDHAKVNLEQSENIINSQILSVLIKDRFKNLIQGNLKLENKIESRSKIIELITLNELILY